MVENWSMSPDSKPRFSISQVALQLPVIVFEAPPSASELPIELQGIHPRLESPAVLSAAIRSDLVRVISCRFSRADFGARTADARNRSAGLVAEIGAN